MKRGLFSLRFSETRSSQPLRPSNRNLELTKVVHYFCEGFVSDGVLRYPKGMLLIELGALLEYSNDCQFWQRRSGYGFGVEYWAGEWSAMSVLSLKTYASR